jgi:hypothetical protein
MSTFGTRIAKFTERSDALLPVRHLLSRYQSLLCDLANYIGIGDGNLLLIAMTAEWSCYTGRLVVRD